MKTSKIKVLSKVHTVFQITHLPSKTCLANFRRQLQDHHPQISVDGLSLHVPAALDEKALSALCPYIMLLN